MPRHRGHPLRPHHSRLCFEIFKAVSGNEDRLGTVHPSGGLNDQCVAIAAMIPWRAHLYDAIDIAPINAQIERRGANQRAQIAARHRRFNLAPRLGGKLPMMDADGQIGFVQIP